MHGLDGSFRDGQFLGTSFLALHGGFAHGHHLVDFLQLSLVVLVDEPILLALVLDVVEAEFAVAVGLVELLLEHLQVGEVFHHLLDVVVDEV